MRPRLAFPIAVGIAAIVGSLTGCGGANSVPMSLQQHRPATQSRGTQRAPSLPARILIAANGNNGNLEYWPINKHGGTAPTALVKGLGLSQAQGMAADGKVLAVTDDSQILLYDLGSMKATALPDSYGVSLDVAIGRDGSIYGLNLQEHGNTNVVVYPKGENNPVDVLCPIMSEGEYIAVDNESDVFIAGYEGDGEGVAEIPSGTQQCNALKLRKLGLTYMGGIAIDPVNDDLLVMDNPGLCAGGLEGRVFIYPKPYQPKTSYERDLGGNCTGGLRLNYDATKVFWGDESIDGANTMVHEADYPYGHGPGSRATYSGGQPLGFTTIPNHLPN